MRFILHGLHYGDCQFMEERKALRYFALNSSKSVFRTGLVGFFENVKLHVYIFWFVSERDYW